MLSTIVWIGGIVLVRLWAASIVFAAGMYPHSNPPIPHKSLPKSGHNW